MKEMMPKRQ